jgi:hypothetical protein
VKRVRLFASAAAVILSLIAWPSSAQVGFSPECTDFAEGVVQIEGVIISAVPDAPFCSTILHPFGEQTVSVVVLSGFSFGVPAPVPPPPVPVFVPQGVVGGRVSVTDEFGNFLGSAECGPTLGGCFASFTLNPSSDAVVTCETWQVTVAVQVLVFCDTDGF